MYIVHSTECVFKKKNSTKGPTIYYGFSTQYPKHSLSFLRTTPNLPLLYLVFGTIELVDGWMRNDEAMPSVTVCVLHPIFFFHSLLALLFLFTKSSRLFCVLFFCVYILHFKIIKVFFSVFMASGSTNWMSTRIRAAPFTIAHISSSSGGKKRIADWQ